MSEATFLFRDIPALRKRVHRLGLALNYGIDERGIRAALEGGVNYIFWKAQKEPESSPLREALRRDRERLVIAAVPTVAYFGWNVRLAAERALRSLGVDYLDVLQLGWLGRGSAWTQSTVDALLKLREEGKVRAIGVSIHDRKRAGLLAQDSPLDMLMLRYNAAHPGAERDVFPNLKARSAGQGQDAEKALPPFIVAYTATSWGQLLKPPAGFTGTVPTAGDCYRFCLSNPHVDIVLSGPASLEQHEQNLKALQKGPLSDTEMKWMRDFGQLVHEKSRIPFSPS